MNEYTIKFVWVDGTDFRIRFTVTMSGSEGFVLTNDVESPLRHFRDEIQIRAWKEFSLYLSKKWLA